MVIAILNLTNLFIKLHKTNTDHGNTVKMEVIRVLKDCSSLIHT